MRPAVIGCLLCLAVPANADESVVKGELTFNSGGIGKIFECGSGRVVTLGVMASNPYFHLTQKYKELSDGGKMPVVIEVSGKVAKKKSLANGETTINMPTVVALRAGTCDGVTPNYALERTRGG